MAGVTFLQRVADSLGRLVEPLHRAIRFGFGFTVTSSPSTSLSGTTSAEVVGCYDVAIDTETIATRAYVDAEIATVSGGREYASTGSASGTATAVAGEHLQLSGGGYTVTLPAASASPAGTVIGWTLGDATPGSAITFARTGSDNIGATGTATTLVAGASVGDYFGEFVTDGVSRWRRHGYSPAELSAGSVSATGDAYFSAGGAAIVSGFGGGGVQISAYGDAVTIYGASGVVVDGALFLVPVADPGTPTTGSVLYCDEADGITYLRKASGTRVTIG